MIKKFNRLTYTKKFSHQNYNLFETNNIILKMKLGSKVQVGSVRRVEKKSLQSYEHDSDYMV